MAGMAQASLSVRVLLGDPTPPVLLAEAAREWMLPLATLVSASAPDMLPTLRGGNRQLVYTTSIREAQENGLLHTGHGQPAHRLPIIECRHTKYKT